jgi:Mg-chelatase subunit ChlD
MWGAPLDRAVECAVGLVETAKNNKDTFSAIDFSSGMGWHVEPTTAYDDAIEKISRLPSGGTTELYQAAMQALKHAKREGKQCTVVVTDTEIWDIEKCKSVLSLLTKYGKVLVFAIGSRSEHDVYGPTEKVLKNVGAKLYAVPDPKQSFTFDALKELW